MHRYSRAFRSVLFALGFVFLAGAGTPAVQAPPPSTVSTELLIKTARAAIAEGKLEDAELLLKGVKPDEGSIDDLDFLWGTIALKRGQWQTAIGRFRAMLARNPDLPRVRLDLALAYFQAGEDGNAAYHFRLALGDEDLPVVVRAHALAFLDRIRRRKSWSVTGSVALAPDTNVNNATSARQVELFGLPASLSEEARETSGVGVTANISGGYERRISQDLRLRAGAGLRTRTYRESDFNERVLSLRAGPRILFDKFDLRPQLTARQRWLGGNDYSLSYGTELSGNWTVAPTLRLGASLGREWTEYETFLGDSHIDSLGLDLAHALGKATLVRGETALRREALDEDAYSWREVVVGLTVSRELSRGFVVSGGPVFRLREYGAPLPAFGPKARRDRTLGTRVTVSNRYVSLAGFMPEITIRHEQRESNLALYDYRRTAAEIGLVRSF